jgi:hypothetical protein
MCVGPYTYAQHIRRFNVSFDDSVGSLTYQTWTYYSFDQELSGEGLSENDQTVSINNAFIGKTNKERKTEN